MRLLASAWDEVVQSTIANCWNHTQICPTAADELEDAKNLRTGWRALTTEATNLRAGWDVILEFATTKMPFPQAEKRLKDIFGIEFVASDWKSALDAVMDAEEDAAVAELAVRALMPDFTKDSASPPTLPNPIANDRRLKEAESAFADVLQTLRRDRCLRGEEATIDELLDPQIEQEDFDSEFLRFAEGEEGTREILEYLKLRDEDEQDKEDLQEP
ncbi:hypothetical protein B0H10DRAFT_1888667, partial [Mycena sp. CBHHK59/15]